MRGRKNGCPTNIRDWQISIQDKAGMRWVRVRGLRQMNRETESETADGSAATDLWAEPYVTKRSAVLRLNGRAVCDAATGERDEGQQLLDDYAETAGCEGDAAIRFADPYGHALEADFVVTAAGREANDTEYGVSWELRQVGEAEELPYVPVTAVSLTENALTMAPNGTPAAVGVSFTPENASNRRFRVSVTGRQAAIVSDVTESGFTVTPVAPGAATVTVTSLNGQRTATLTVTVEE